MKTRRNAGYIFKEASTGRNKAPPNSPSIRVQVTINPAALADGEVRVTLIQMAQDISAQAQAITALATRDDAPRENPHTLTCRED